MNETRQFITRQEAQLPLFAGIDLGGTNIKIGLVDDLGRSLCWHSIATDAEKGPEAAAQRMGGAVLYAADKAGLKPADIAYVGLGAPGIIDIPAGMLVAPNNIRGWDNFPIRDRVAHHCGRPVFFQNDANAAAYGEFWVGGGREYHSLVFFTLGTGIGSGIIIGDMCIDGENSHGGECGHVIIDFAENARLCGCGKRGHLEAYASATAVIKRTDEALQAGRKSSLSRRLAEGAELSPLLVAQEAEAGDEFAMEMVMDTARFIGIGAVCLMNTIDPSVVLLGGAMTFGGHDSELGRRFLARIKEEVQRRGFPILAQRTVIDFATLGGDAGYIGAAGFARLEYCKKKKG
jgi:glucokinase